mmetsp:Transcript_17129/g.47105  ORF Transcript_17129/g.47105 Transcript_17129/m.47105 type:complete len:85 (-) Transcript_17129:1947-2201(-)
MNAVKDSRVSTFGAERLCSSEEKEETNHQNHQLFQSSREFCAEYCGKYLRAIVDDSDIELWNLTFDCVIESTVSTVHSNFMVFL